MQCQEIGSGSDLVSFHDREENDYILQEIIRSRSQTNLWMGAVNNGEMLCMNPNLSICVAYTNMLVSKKPGGLNTSPSQFNARPSQPNVTPNESGGMGSGHYCVRLCVAFVDLTLLVYFSSQWLPNRNEVSGGIYVILF